MIVWIVCECDDDPYAGVHPLAAFSDESRCDEWIAYRVHNDPSAKFLTYRLKIDEGDCHDCYN